MQDVQVCRPGDTKCIRHRQTDICRRREGHETGYITERGNVEKGSLSPSRLFHSGRNLRLLRVCASGISKALTRRDKRPKEAEQSEAKQMGWNGNMEVETKRGCSMRNRTNASCLPYA